MNLFFNHKAVSAFLIKSHVEVFLCIYLVLDSNPMRYFLFDLKAKKKKYSLQTNLHYNFPFCHVKMYKLQYFLISSKLKDYNKLKINVFTLSQQVQYGQNSFTPKKHSHLNADGRASSPAKLHSFKIKYHHGSKIVALDNLKFLILRDLLLQNQ